MRESARTLRTLVLLALGLSALVAVYAWVGFERLGALLTRADVGCLPPMIACVLLIALVGALNLRLLFLAFAPVRACAFIARYWVSWAWGMFLPSQVGEIASLALLLKGEGIAWSRTTGVMLVDKAISFAVIVGAGALGLLYALGRAPTELVIVLPLLPAGFVGGVLGASRLPEGGAGFRARALSFAGRSARTMLLFAREHPRRLALNFLFTLGKLAITTGASFFAFRAFGLRVGYFETMFLSSAAGLAAFVPVTLNGIGAVEAAAVGLFALRGHEGAAVVAAYTVLRLSVIAAGWLPMPWLLVYVRRAGTPPE